MPQPLSRVIPNGQFKPNPNVLDDKPELATLVASIFGHWAHIEQCLGLLLIRILGADAEPAIAMFSVLTAQHLQMATLGAAAKAALSSDDFDVFEATRRVAEIVQSDRNRLAHWIWGECSELPDALLLAEPRAQKDRDRQIALFVQRSIGHGPPDIAELNRVAQFDPSTISVYRKNDLENVKRDLAAGYKIAHITQVYLNRMFVATPTPYSVQLREMLLSILCRERLFQEAYDRLRAGRQTSPPVTP